MLEWVSGIRAFVKNSWMVFPADHRWWIAGLLASPIYRASQLSLTVHGQRLRAVGTIHKWRPPGDESPLLVEYRSIP
jgi:hypothetical protein